MKKLEGYKDHELYDEKLIVWRTMENCPCGVNLVQYTVVQYYPCHYTVLRHLLWMGRFVRVVMLVVILIRTLLCVCDVRIVVFNSEEITNLLRRYLPLLLGTK